jgi:hypothetical protein
LPTDPDSPTWSRFADRIRICQPDPKFVDWIRIRWLDLSTGSGFSAGFVNRIMICRPDLDPSTGSGFADRIWIHLT